MSQTGEFVQSDLTPQELDLLHKMVDAPDRDAFIDRVNRPLDYDENEGEGVTKP